MKLLIVRHGDPDYSIDSLTPKGWREAELLSNKLSRMEAEAYYVSPLGRARDTASLTMQKLGKEAVELEWLKEFPPHIQRPDKEELSSITWDWLPQDWMTQEQFFREDLWQESDVMRNGKVREEYDRVTGLLDDLLKTHGYEREGRWYRAVRPNNDTLVLFCHFGLECVLLSHLLNISPMVLWHGTCAAPTSITTVVTEERRRGIASFRMTAFGDISHLYAGQEPPAFAARFCECYDNKNQRHD